jgi:hypothetical protein
MVRPQKRRLTEGGDGERARENVNACLERVENGFDVSPVVLVVYRQGHMGGTRSASDQDLASVARGVTRECRG